MHHDEIHRLLDFQPDVVWRLRAGDEPCFDYVSPSAIEVMGHPPEAFVADLELWYRMVHRRDLHLLGVGQPPQSDGPDAEPRRDEALVRFFRADGEMRWAEVRWRTVEEPTGVTIYGVTRDVTERENERQAARRAEARLLEAETLANIGSFDWDLATDRMWFSLNLFRIFGQDPQSWEPSFHAFEAMLLDEGEVASARRVVKDVVDRGAVLTDDVQVRRPDGSVRTLDIVGLTESDDDGRAVRLHGVIRDVTEDRAMEQARRMFIADAAHELRTPVATLIGSIGIIRRQLDTMDRHAREEALDLLVRQSHRLRDLSTSLLDLGALDQHVEAVELEPRLVHPIVVEVASAHPPPPGIVLRTPDADVAALADAWRLERVLVNLVTNAYRYARTRVEVSVTETENGVVIVVEDDGPGVPPAAVDGLFNAFHRAPGEQGSGSGLGLAIARRLTETMRGSIAYRSPAGGGACFEIRLRRP